MQIYHKIEDVPFFDNTIITIGTFDGLHLGHQEMIGALLKVANINRARHLLVTFDPHPLTVVGGDDKTIMLLTTSEEKLPIFQNCNVENVLFMPFTRELAILSASSFIEDVLIKNVGLSGLVIGFNNTLGHDRTGTIEKLKEISVRLGFFIQQVEPVSINRQIVSSTSIRKAILSGDVETARTWLGRPFSLKGNVISGKQVGRSLGFPTANLNVPKEKLVPKDGVYAVLIQYESQIYTGLANIGHSPTIPGKSYGIEIFIDNFSEIIYNKGLEVQFIERVRDEEKFISSDAMITQIKKDQKRAQIILAPYIRR